MNTRIHQSEPKHQSSCLTVKATVNKNMNKTPYILFNCKKGVWFKFMGHLFLDLTRIVYEEYQKDWTTPTVTSAGDGRHRQGSLHPFGLAWDWRIWGLKDPGRTADRIRKKAKKLDVCYDIIFGDKEHLDHIHSEYDVRKRGGSGTRL